MWREKTPLNLDLIWLCHPNFWDMAFILRYYKNLNLKIDPSTLRKKCIDGTFQAYKSEIKVGSKKLTWFINREQVINYGQKTLKKACK